MFLYPTKMAKKAIDRGNKRRFFKNAFRMIKNPFGYFFWKTYKFRQARGRIILTFFTLNALFGFWAYKRHSRIIIYLLG